MVKINENAFEQRVRNLQEWMRRHAIDACFVYGDEYRRENLRYISNVWPVFERGAAVIPLEGEPLILGAPEGELMCREMSAWQDIRLIAEFTCVTVPDEIDYPFANYTSFGEVFSDMRQHGALRRVAVSGLEDMPKPLLDALSAALEDAAIVDASPVLSKLRLVKTGDEIKCLDRAAKIADQAYLALMRAAQPGVTELELAGTAIGEAMIHGAEHVPFCLVTSGERVKTIIGRASGKIILENEMVMAALAVQYEGYIASFGFPFVVGKPDAGQIRLIDILIGSYEKALEHLKPGVEQHVLVEAVKAYFAETHMTAYDLYPPLHGCGLSEAESPYPNEQTRDIFLENMTVNTDISLFGHEDGSNRIETSLVVTADGYKPLSGLIVPLIDAWKTERGYQALL
ncbi:MAG: aminopeptidase P family protein [Ruminococcaceae bacterium]|nr:aminopeptidase P family protein [Oscillospiraceae bacterium]